MTALYGAIHCDVADATVVFHCDHAHDSASYRITADDAEVKIYLTGTPEQLGAFADAIVRTVSRHTIEVHERAAAAAFASQSARALEEVYGSVSVKLRESSS